MQAAAVGRVKFRQRNRPNFLRQRFFFYLNFAGIREIRRGDDLLRVAHDNQFGIQRNQRQGDVGAGDDAAADGRAVAALNAPRPARHLRQHALRVSADKL